MTQTPEDIAVATRKAYDESTDILADAFDAIADAPAPPDGELRAAIVAWYMATDDYEAQVARRIDNAIADEAAGVAERRQELSQ